MVNVNYPLLRMIAFIIVLVGAINWGLVGLFSVDLIASIFGNMTLFSRLIYIIVGVAGGFLIYMDYIRKDVTPPPAP